MTEVNKDKYCDIEHLKGAMKEFNMNQSELGKAFGMSDGFINHCLSRGSAPRWTMLAVECFRRRAGLSKDDVTFVIKVPGNKKVAVEVFLEALGISTTAI